MSNDTPATDRQIEIARAHRMAGCDENVCRVVRPFECAHADEVTPLSLILRIDKEREHRRLTRTQWQRDGDGLKARIDELRAERERYEVDVQHACAEYERRIRELENVAGPPLTDCCGRFAVEHFPSASVPGPQYMWCPNHDSPVIQTPMFIAWVESRRGSRAK